MKYYSVQVEDNEDPQYLQCWSIYDCKPGDYVRVDIGNRGRNLIEARVDSELTAMEVEDSIYPVFSNESALDAALGRAESKRNAREALRKLIMSKLSEDDFKVMLKAVRELVPDAEFLIDQYLKGDVTTQ